MKAVLDADLHLYRVVAIRRHAVAMDPYISLLDNLRDAPRDGDADEVAQLDVDPVVRLVLLLDVLELELVRLRAPQLAGCC